MLTIEDKALKLVQKAGVFRASELEPYGIPRTALSRLAARGKVRRVARGLYEPSDIDPNEHHSLMEVCKRVPRGVVCLISALIYHEMTTQMPYMVWLAIPAGDRTPKIGHLSTRIVRFSSEAVTHGIEEHKTKGVMLRVTSPAKTVADCFKFRNKVGIDVAIEALKEYRRGRKGTMDDLVKAAEVCRVRNVMRPYLDAIL